MWCVRKGTLSRPVVVKQLSGPSLPKLMAQFNTEQTGRCKINPQPFSSQFNTDVDSGKGTHTQKRPGTSVGLLSCVLYRARAVATNVSVFCFHVSLGTGRGLPLLSGSPQPSCLSSHSCCPPVTNPHKSKDEPSNVRLYVHMSCELALWELPITLLVEGRTSDHGSTCEV